MIVVEQLSSGSRHTHDRRGRLSLPSRDQCLSLRRGRGEESRRCRSSRTDPGPRRRHRRPGRRRRLTRGGAGWRGRRRRWTRNLAAVIQDRLPLRREVLARIAVEWRDDVPPLSIGPDAREDRSRVSAVPVGDDPVVEDGALVDGDLDVWVCMRSRSVTDRHLRRASRRWRGCLGDSDSQDRTSEDDHEQQPACTHDLPPSGQTATPLFAGSLPHSVPYQPLSMVKTAASRPHPACQANRSIEALGDGCARACYLDRGRWRTSRPAPRRYENHTLDPESVAAFPSPLDRIGTPPAQKHRLVGAARSQPR